MSRFRISVSFYDSNINLHPGDIADNLDVDASDQEIRRAILEDLDSALSDGEFPSYYVKDGIDDFVEHIREELNRRKEEDE